MTTLNTIIEEENIALEKKIGDFTFNNGGALELTLWDIVDERVHEIDEVGTVIQDHLTTAMQRAYEAGRADWLRSEIEKLGGMKKDGSKETRDRIEKDGYGYLYERLTGFNIAITDIITRYKEELLESDRK